MPEFYATTEQSELFQVEAQITKEIVEQLANIEMRDAQLDIKAFLRGKSRISIGQPITFSISEWLIAHNEAMPTDIRMQLKTYDFCVIHLSCSFMPADGSRFFDAQFNLELRNLRLGGDIKHTDRPMIYDLYPRSIREEVKINRKFSLSPELKLEFDDMKPDVSLIKYEKSKEYIEYQSSIESFGLQEHKAGWRFTRTEQKEILGSYEMFFVARKVKGTQLVAQFSLEARIEPLTNVWPIRQLPLTTTFLSSGRVIDEPNHILC